MYKVHHSKIEQVQLNSNLQEEILPALGCAARLILITKFISKVTSFQETEGKKFLADLT